METSLTSTAVIDITNSFSNLYLFWEKNMSKNKKNFNFTQGMVLLLLKKLSLPPNLGFQMILYLTNPINSFGNED